MATVFFDPLDVTPRFRLSTFQFQSQFINIIVTSLLTSLILANISAIVFKCISFTSKNHFHYSSWLRAYIFSHTDDPVRLLSWIRHSYPYRDKKWKRQPQGLHLSRLIMPLVARLVVFLITIASIAVAIPQRREVKGCENGDFAPVWNSSRLTGHAFEIALDNVACVDIPMTTITGTVRSTASYCYHHDQAFFDGPTGLTTVSVSRDVVGKKIVTELFVSGTRSKLSSTLVWRDSEHENVMYYSDVTNMSLSDQLDIATSAIEDLPGECSKVGMKRLANRLSADFACDVEARSTNAQLTKYHTLGLTWKHMGEVQKRLKVRVGGNRDGEIVEECPYYLVEETGMLNILPSVVLLAVVWVFNVGMSIIRARHGDAFDATFHLVKEAIGLDTTTNALEGCKVVNDDVELQLRKWMCYGTKGGYIGFLERPGGEEVDEFEADAVVGGCIECDFLPPKQESYP